MGDSSVTSAPFVDLLNALRTANDEDFERNLALLRSPTSSNGNPGNVKSGPLQMQSLSTPRFSQQDYPKQSHFFARIERPIHFTSMVTC